jgi:hypothetical protein
MATGGRSHGADLNFDNGLAHILKFTYLPPSPKGGIAVSLFGQPAVRNGGRK